MHRSIPQRDRISESPTAAKPGYTTRPASIWQSSTGSATDANEPSACSVNRIDASKPSSVRRSLKRPRPGTPIADMKLPRLQNTGVPLTTSKGWIVCGPWITIRSGPEPAITASTRARSAGTGRDCISTNTWRLTITTSAPNLRPSATAAMISAPDPARLMRHGSLGNPEFELSANETCATRVRRTSITEVAASAGERAVPVWEMPATSSAASVDSIPADPRSHE